MLLRVLLVEDNPDHAVLIRRLARKTGVVGELVGVARLSDALAQLDARGFDAVLLDLSLPDSELQTTLPRVLAAHPVLPIIVLTSLNDENIVANTLQQGAQDYLVKTELNAPLLARSLRYAVDRARANQALAEAKAAAEAANRAKGEFLATMSHEIRTPMSAILGYADLLATRLNAPEDLHSVQTIRRNGRYLLTLINDILDLSKIDAGRLEIQRERVALDALLDEVRTLMVVPAREKGLGFQVETLGLLPATIATDPRRLKQILINLLGNAIKFTPMGQVGLRVRLREAQAQIVFDVVDTGIGISAEQQDTLFQPFSQGDAADAYEGTGLGLAISRRLAELLGGGIRVQSRLAKGSTFSLTVATGDLTDVPRVTLRLRSTSVEPARTPASLRLQHRALVVDDHADIRELVRHLLQAVGMRVEAVTHGGEALAAVARAEIQHAPFDVVLIDMQMPVLDGYGTTQRLRASGFARPIIALTAGAMKGDRERCLQAGCDDYLAKPVDGQQLLALLARHLGESPPSRRDPDQELPEQTEPDRSQGLRVLIVDDSEDAANALAAMLKTLDYQVQVAYDGRTALKLARKVFPQVVITDINLPDINGFEVARRLRAAATEQETVVIGLSGQDGFERQAGSHGFDHCLLKPASLQALLGLFPPLPRSVPAITPCSHE